MATWNQFSTCRRQGDIRWFWSLILFPNRERFSYFLSAGMEKKESHDSWLCHIWGLISLIHLMWQPASLQVPAVHGHVAACMLAATTCSPTFDISTPAASMQDGEVTTAGAVCLTPPDVARLQPARL
jgi:hypothetical protein